MNKKEIVIFILLVAILSSVVGIVSSNLIRLVFNLDKDALTIPVNPSPTESLEYRILSEELDKLSQINSLLIEEVKQLRTSTDIQAQIINSQKSLYVHTLDWDKGNPQPVYIEWKMASGIGNVFLGCEVRGSSKVPYVTLGNIVSSNGHAGQAQIDKQWSDEMAAMGLDFNVEKDRIEFAAWLWEHHNRRIGDGWNDWQCKP